MNQKQRRTLAALFEDPTRANIAWNDVESLLVGLGATITEGRGSRVRVELNGVKTVLHEPHPQRELGKAMVRSIRDFLVEAEVSPDVE